MVWHISIFAFAFLICSGLARVKATDMELLRFKFRTIRIPAVCPSRTASRSPVSIAGGILFPPPALQHLLVLCTDREWSSVIQQAPVPFLVVPEI